MHGGWGHDVYPFDLQVETLAAGFHLLVPDRSGYGKSSPVEQLGRSFHQRAVLETLALMDGLGLQDAVWWGHSDGAVIAAMAAIDHPERCRGVILEALHFDTAKPGSREFFERMTFRPDSFGPSLTARLALDHGERRWRRVLELDGAAWLELAAHADAIPDLFEGQLGQLRVPALLIHGGADPRSEPGEWEAIRAALPEATVAFYPAGGHSPHTEAATAHLVTEAVRRFLAPRT